MTATYTAAFEGTAEERDAVLERLERFAHLMDSTFRVPGTDFRVGLEAIVGAVLPGAGDLAGALIACYIPFEAVRLGAPWPLVGRMMLNIIIDGVVGTIPVLGDALDVVWKPNERNVRLFEEWLGVA